MERSMSPNYTNGYEEDPIFQKTHYTQDISEQMRVPKRIRATGEYNDDIDQNYANGNGWHLEQKFDMTVPDRIVVMGQDQHLGTRSAPREIILDNSILPTDPDHVRVSTPPRVITLSQHHFPSASDEPPLQYTNDEPEDYDQTFSLNDEKVALNNVKQTKFMMNYSREATPLQGDNLSPSEEMLNLRRQVAKLNRRVLAIELDNVQRQQRDKIVYCIGLAYFVIKAFMWLSRN